MKRYPIRAIATHSMAILLLMLVALVCTAPVQAGGAVTNCANDADFSSKLAGGGTVTFSCGTASISFTGTKSISANTIIDGGGVITLSGGFGYRLFTVNNGVTLTLQNIKLVNGYNSSSAGGGAITNYGHLILNNVTIQNMPDSGYNGGAIATYGALDITDSTFTNNKATNGGAVYANGASAIVSIENSRFEYNKATGIIQNTNGFGGGIYTANNAQVTIQAGTFYSNTGNDGGAIYTGNTSILNLQASTLTENYAAYKGGALLNSGTGVVTNSTLQDNVGLLGGAIFNYGTLTTTQSTLARNHGQVGGALNNYLGTANLTTVTLSGNAVTAYGGAVNNYAATLNLTNATLYGNNAGFGKGIENQNNVNTHLNLVNVIISNGAVSGNCDFGKAPDTSDHNLSSDATCNFGAGRDSVNMKLGKLETNGGNTLTHRLLPGSLAIDNGVFVNTILTDQRSVTRPRGAAFDVGAVEFVPCAGLPTAPVLLSPALSAQVNTQAVLLDWAGPDCVKTFSVAVRQGSKTGAIVFAKSNLKPTQVTTASLAKNQKYFWQVKACNAAGCATSSWGKFTVK